MKKLYYIKGNEKNPEGVKQALIDVCPELQNTDLYKYNEEKFIYFIWDNEVRLADSTQEMYEIVTGMGTELLPKVIKKCEVEEKIMYQALGNLDDGTYLEFDKLCNSVEELFLIYDNPVGYREVKVKVFKQ